MNNRIISWAIFVLLCFIWGSSFILMQYSTQQLTAYQIASIRTFLAGLVFLPFAIFHIRRIPKNKIIIVILAGIFGNLLPAFLFAIAIAQKIDSSLAGILNSLTPICVVLIGIVFFRDRFSTQKIIGVLIGFGGLVLLTVTQKNIYLDHITYALLIVLSTIFYGINVNMVSHYLKGVNPIALATVSLSCLILPTAIVLWQQDFLQLDFSDVHVRWAITASAALGIVGSAIATALFYTLVQRASGLFASLVTYGVPFVALFWGFVFGEKITLLEIICLGIILVGVFLANPYRKS